MIKNGLLFTYITFAAAFAQAQSINAERYKDKVFKDVTISKDISYNPNARDKQKKSYLFDIYQPKGDQHTQRPLIIWMHGGGFKFGSKTSKGTKLWADEFARRGYVCASINYRLSGFGVLFHFDDLLQATYYATQDAKAAVAYFRENAARFGIDPQKIILAGNSAGGFLALEATYAKNEDFGHMANIPDQDIKNSLPQPNIFAVINYWGGIFNLEWLKNAKTPIISVHGRNDGLVPITHKDAPLHGSLDIKQKADELHIPNTLKIYEGYSHELQKHFNPLYEGASAKKRWREAAQFTADYLYNLLNDKP